MCPPEASTEASTAVAVATHLSERAAVLLPGLHRSAARAQMSQRAAPCLPMASPSCSTLNQLLREPAHNGDHLAAALRDELMVRALGRPIGSRGIASTNAASPRTHARTHARTRPRTHARTHTPTHARTWRGRPHPESLPGREQVAHFQQLLPGCVCRWLPPSLYPERLASQPTATCPR